MGIGRTIRVYLEDGSVTGIRHAEIVNWTGQAISSPRSAVKTLSDWPESRKPGVYFLFGIDEETGKAAAYVGEAENVYSRLQSHIVDKDFWNEVVFFTNKDENLTKAHVKYLESRLVTLAKISKRYILFNGNTPQSPALPRGDRDSMEEFIGNLRVLLGVIGHKVLEPLAIHEKNEPAQLSNPVTAADMAGLSLKLHIATLDAHAEITDEGIVVLKGSFATSNPAGSLSVGYQKLRDDLIKSEVMVESNGKYVFTSDQLFTSPSQAAAVIVGYSINGRDAWRSENGQTLKSIEEQAHSD